MVKEMIDVETNAVQYAFGGRKMMWQFSHFRYCSSAQCAESKVEKFVKLTDHTYAYNNLTNFEYKVHAMTGNGNVLTFAIAPVQCHHMIFRVV